MNNLKEVSATRSLSRIENDVERVKSMTASVNVTIERIVGHARSLGYYEPTPSNPATAPAPVITTLSDALNELSRTIDHCSGSLNVFD